MATIKTVLSIQDAMTKPLRSINRAMNLVISSMEQMQKATRKSVDTKALTAARDELNKMGAAIDDIEKKIKNVNDSTDKTSNTFGKLAKAIGLAAIARKTFDVVKNGIDYASDLAEVQNVVDVTFGNSAATIDAWANDALKAYGMNEVSAKRYAGTIGAMLKSSGLAGDSIVGMSQDMVGLAGDMASFYNLDLETAFEKIRSGISGETEPLKQLGINMSVANLEAFALSQGIDTSYNSMSQAEQVMLRYNYLMNATADAQGDFARTQDSWANQTRLLSESWTKFTGVLATQLLPMLTKVVSFMNKIIEFLTDNSETVSAVLVGIATAVGILSAAWAAQTVAALIAKAANAGLFATLLANPLTWIAIVVGVVVAAIYKWIQSVGGLKNAWEICKLALLVGWKAVQYGFAVGVFAVVDFIDMLRGKWYEASAVIPNYLEFMKASSLLILQDMVNGAIDIINSFINTVNKIPGVTIDAIDHVTFGTLAAEEYAANQASRAKKLASQKNELAKEKAERTAKLASLKNELTATSDALNAKYKQATTAATGGAGSAAEAASETAANTEATAENTGSAASSLKNTSEDLKYLRDLAEQEAINRFTTAEVKIDMTGMTNRISSDMDLDGVLRVLTDGFAEALTVAAEGVHA